MKKKLTRVALIFAATALAATAAFAQGTEKQVVVHPDGSYTVIQYPLNKEVVVNLLPTAGVSGSKAMARVAHMPDGTKVYFDVTGAPSDWKQVYAYAIDPAGNPTLLGPVDFMGGVGKAQFTTPMDEFMLVLSPTNDLKTYDTSTAYVYRSEAPKGYAIVPRRITDTTKAVARAERTGMDYDVPMLGVPKFQGRTTEVRVKFSGNLSGLDGKAYLKPEGGKTTIKMRFGDLRKLPNDKRLVLWATGADGSYTKIGQVITSGSRDEAEIRGETALADFGLLLTIEDVDVKQPTSKVFSTFSIGSN